MHVFKQSMCIIFHNVINNISGFENIEQWNILKFLNFVKQTMNFLEELLSFSTNYKSSQSSNWPILLRHLSLNRALKPITMYIHYCAYIWHAIVSEKLSRQVQKYVVKSLQTTDMSNTMSYYNNGD